MGQVELAIIIAFLLTAALLMVGWLIYEIVGRQRPPKEKTPSFEGAYSDREIESDDEDRFGFKDYAKVLAQRARGADPPLTIGVYGSWGSGKTSLMRLIDAEVNPAKKESGRPRSLERPSFRQALLGKVRDRLPLWQRRSEARIETLWVNVWQLGNQEEVWHAFLQALFSKVHRRLSLWQRIDFGKLVRQLAGLSYRILLVITPMIVGGLLGNPDATWTDVFSLIALNPFAAAPIAGTGTVLTYALALWVVVKPAVEAARESVSFDLQAVLKFPSYEAQITELMRLQGRFKGMVEALVKEGRLIVFIDDLDRCSPDKIPDLLEAIKLFTMTPRCVYVLGLDYDIVRKGIEKKYKFKEEREASEYLEKIVQIPFHMPPLDEGRIESFVDEYYTELHDKSPTAPEIFSRGIEPNPRKVKRALNIYRTLLELADVRVRAWEMDPVEPELVAKMVVIQSRFPQLHEHLVRHSGFLLELEGKALREGGLNRDELTEDEDFGRTLLGAPDGSGPGLVEEAEVAALNNLLRAGDRHFTDPDQREQVSSYIYLIASAEGAAEFVRPSRKERQALLGGDPGTIEKQVEEILGRGEGDERRRGEIAEAYMAQLKGVPEDPEVYTATERTSANFALSLLEGWNRRDFEPLTLRVPAGPFLMGSTDDDQWADDNEKPQHTVELSAYRIGRYPVTNLEYRAFVVASEYEPPEDWDRDQYPDGKGDHPVVNVSWEDASAYCRWLAEATGRPYRLPTEAEWEKAARGQDGRLYPWGNEFEAAKLNSAESGRDETTPVGQFSPEGDSPYGAADMAGNVQEWCADWYDRAEYKRRSEGAVQDLQGPEEGSGRVQRGGTFLNAAGFVRCAGRVRGYPDLYDWLNGFRVALSPS